MAAGRWCARRAMRGASRRHAVRRQRPGRRPPADAHRGRPVRAGTVLGTLNNCASGKTPWGTYLSGEENWAFYFQGGDSLTADQRRWGLRANASYALVAHDERFDARKHPNEFHRFGWVVEIDPKTPASTPSSAPRWAGPRTKAPGSARHPRRPCRGLFGRGRTLRVHLQVRQPRPHQARWRQAQCRAAGPRHAVRGALRRRRPRPLAAAGARPGPADGGQRLCRPGRGGDQVAPGQ
jgi:hypothetical protein